MKLNDIIDILKLSDKLQIALPDGQLVPPHFHITEVGYITRHFIDCGGTERIEKKINFQLYTADDYDHRLSTEKLLKIIEHSQSRLGLGNLEVEVEYQGDTIGKYGIAHDGHQFVLTSQQTACLANEACGLPEKKKVDLSSLVANNSCKPGSGCC